MEVQNAADAAAYSAAILTARELNFMAYTNRAMVANQVTIGQFAAFESWGRKYEMGSRGVSAGFGFFYGLNSILIVGSAISGPLVTIFKTTLSIANGFNKGLSKLMMKLGGFANGFIPVLQKIFVLHQKSLTMGTLATQMETIPKIIDDNAKGATLSNFGALALYLTTLEQNILRSENISGSSACNFSPDIPLCKPFLKTNDDKAGKRRFAAFVNDLRDDWTRDRTRDLILEINEGPFDLIVAEVSLKISLGFQHIFGSTELRYFGNDEKYNWSSLDAVAGGLSATATIDPIIGPTINIPNFLPDFLPFGGATAETIEEQSSSSDRLNRNLAKWKGGDYAGTWDDWKKVAPAGEAVSLGYKPGANTKFGGLPDFVDINEGGYSGVKSAPAFLISVRKNAEKIKTSDHDDLDMATGQFEVKTALAGGKNGFGDTTEGEPATAISGFISDMGDQFRNTLTANLSGLPVSRFPPAQRLVDTVTDVATQFENTLLRKADGLILFLGRAFRGVNHAEEKGGVFALAQAEIYFKNPDGTETVNGSTFSPYWQVRLKPVPDDIRRWSVISQGYAVDRPRELSDDTHLNFLKVMATQRR